MLLKYNKQYLSVFAVATTIFVTYSAYNAHVRPAELPFYNQHFTTSKQIVKNTGPSDTISSINITMCKLPDYDPLDPSITKYIKKWPNINCGQPQPPLTYVDDNFTLKINYSGLKAAKIPAKDFKCTYSEIVRKPNDDYHIILRPAETLLEPENLTTELSIIRCFKGKRMIYETGHAQVRPLNPKLAEKSAQAQINGASNVLIFGIDSMSRLNFIRQLPKTHNVIKNLYNAVTLRGLTKVGDNTRPNLLALTSGLGYKYGTNKRFGPLYKEDYFDDLPAVWKNFSSNGYVTMFAEDLPQYAIFNYHTKGFHQPPTDYYLRPLYLAMDNLKNFKSSDSRCYSHLPKHQFVLNYTEQFIMNMHRGGNAYFTLSFLTALSHNRINSVKVVDDEFAALFTRLHKSGAMERTMVIFMGDHGNRFDAIRKTVIGRVEERMPFIAIALPKALEHFRENLKRNSEVLTSWYDVYETIMDVAVNNLKPEPRQVRFGYHGLSLFRHIPNNRTCSDVAVPIEYCVCWIEQELNLSDSRVKSAGQELIMHVNKLVREKYSLEICAHLDLDQVLSAQLLFPPEKVAKPSDSSVMLRVTVRAKPSGALLEGTLEQTSPKNKSKVIGDINRINQYGNQSLCISDTILKLYCFCKND